VKQPEDVPAPLAGYSPEAQIAHLRMMLEVGRALNSTLDLDTLLNKIIEVATQITETEAASILLLDTKTGDLRFEAATVAKRAEVTSIIVPLEGSIAGWIVSHGQPLMANDVRRDLRYYAQADRVTQFETRSLLGVPLRTKETTIGALEVLNKRGNSGFGPQDIEMLEALAAQAAVAITNARLFAQNDQLADVVHELRTPMTSIVGYSKMLLTSEGLAPEMQKSFLETIHREAARLGRIVNEFLDLTRLESGRVHLKREPVNMEQLAREAVMQMLPEASARGVEVHLHADDYLPPVGCDREGLKQVLMHLLRNAIKYNRQGGRVDLSLGLYGGRFCISVTDTGLGIAPENLPHVFDKFYRVERDENLAKGAGLGLSIVKQIVESHGGKIWVESKPDAGSTFTFTLPVERRR
jgi:signal transduction histidine kinase